MMASHGTPAHLQGVHIGARPGAPASVVIRNRNESHYLRPVLEALVAQTTSPCEIVIVDNESTDGSSELARSFGAKVVPISRDEFTYGAALNRGIGAASNDIVVLLSAHSLPLSSTFLERTLAAFDNPSVAAACCRDIRFIDSHGRWTDGRVVTSSAGWKDIWDATIESRGCAIRRSVWQSVPFDETLEAAEDRAWSRAVLLAGFTIVSSDAFYWYMRRPTLWAGLQVYRREMTAMYRIGADIGNYPFTRLLATCLLEIPRMAARRGIDAFARYTLFKTIPFHASRPARRGSIR
jgi:rhamnosyltransferase